MGVTAAGTSQRSATRSDRSEEFDAVIVGASLAGSAAAVKLGRAGARVALVEQRPDPAAYKQVCSHYVQASAVPTLERLGLLQPALDAGAVRSNLRIWTGFGEIVPPHDRTTPGLNLRRELLDPLLRDAALNTPGVEARLGLTAVALERDGGARVRGVVARDRSGAERLLRARLVVGADGRGSRIAKLAGVATKTTPHGRIAYGGYFEGADLPHAPDAKIWMLDPQWAAAFPTDAGLTFYAAMPTKAWLPRFKRDPEAALVAFLRDLPDPPPIEHGRLVGEIKGKVDMTNVEHEPIAAGLALVGDAALATDPLWGIGCGWALQQAEWLGDAVGDALAAGPRGGRGARRRPRPLPPPLAPRAARPSARDRRSRERPASERRRALRLLRGCPRRPPRGADGRLRLASDQPQPLSRDGRAAGGLRARA